MDDQNKNLILATALSFLVILVWFVVFPPEEPVIDPNAPEISDSANVPAVDTAPVAATAGSGEAGGETAVAEAARIAVKTDALSGSISLAGGRIDDLKLTQYNETIEDGSPQVTLLRPEGTAGGYFSLFGWAPGGALDFADVPGPTTAWTQVGTGELTPETPVQLEWSNGKGLTFQRQIAIDAENMFTVTQTVQNTSGADVRLAPYAEVVRQGEPVDLKGFFIIHEGAIQQTGGSLNELSYKDMRNLGRDETWGASTEVTAVDQNGWLGFTDHYWMTTIIPAQTETFSSVLRYEPQTDRYKTIARRDAMTVAAGTSATVETRFFAGAKEWELLRNYEREGVYRFVDSIDWGWFFFLTKPIFRLLHALNGFIGNMGWSIIVLTLIIKGILFPLAYRSYVSMAKMKELQPEMEKIKEKAGDDRQKLQQEMMALYKKEKVNPASGCLPILMQIPIFFSLYKVIFVTIELRHAAWFGPFQDLSAPDPTSIMNLFGLLPFTGPETGTLMATIFLGILPLLLGISMWLQQKLNPAPTDPTQAMVFAWMPWVFMFMLGSFASGLVVYWIANNTITFIQQYSIMRSQGYKPDVLGNITSGFKRKKPESKAGK
ncbi:membrane protein insertase YidC [Pseudoruegeria sp. SHC-113]|uniref:membrane protein insertase YidC n=1 Tax=Pseudoruegeria sp. SHC-113 TaxID=2855439 RepID=UPI0021BB5FBD|nr:membrane protein insertase YidC [Pseudoruegeria sp. SHC-113]MCT8161430.1 membrane protein insertase YidC [Pseudoruegeria sp. SHC-113]